MSSTDLENNDLQTYLDSFNKEIEEDGLETEEHKMVIDSIAQADETDEEKDSESTYFLDQVGNYYYQATDDRPKTFFSKANQSRKHGFLAYNKERSKEIIPNKKTSTYAEENNGGESNEEMDYVLILDNATGKEIYPNELDPDDPDKEIYEFDENDEVNNDGNPSNNNEEVEVRTSVVRLKPNSTDAVTHSCMHCNYKTEKRYLLSRHLRTHSDDRPFRCSVCERGFKSNASLLNHLNSHLGNKPHHCKSCEMAFTTSGELVRHVRYKHTLEKPHKCTECDYASVELSKLKRHMRCHTGERPYQCPHCTYASPDTFKLKRHMRTHTGEKPYECDICHARFTQSNSMKAHRMIHSVGAKPVFQCSLCPTTCGRKTDLRIHIQKLHHSEEPINCKRCGKSFPDRYSYKVHIKTHEGEKCYRCNLCPYASISLRHLESHMLIHTDQKPFVCNICELAFRQKQLLKRHINLYHDKLYVPPTPREKRHACPDCKRSFSHKGNLMRHMELHDPDSNLKQEKLKLKLGRNTRVSADGSIEVLGSGNEMETEEYYDGKGEYYEGTEEEFEIIEMVDDELEEQKPAMQHSLLNIAAKEPSSSKKVNDALPDIKTVSIKKEPDGKEFVAVEGADGKQYMVVEVIHCADEDDETEVIESTMEEHEDPNDLIVNAHKTDVDNCFGFEEVEDEEYVDDSDNKETIQLLEIIDDD